MAVGSFTILYQVEVVERNISALPPAWKKNIRLAIEEKLTQHPEVFGKPLRRSLKGYRKLRVGDYRVVFRIEGRDIHVLAILHRSVVYGTSEKHI